MTEKVKKIIKYEKRNVVKEYQFPVLELPTILIYLIIAKLPLRTIFSCRAVCKAFRELIGDPYFTKTHLKEALSTSTAIIVKGSYLCSPSFRPYILELDYTPKKSPCFSDHQFYNKHVISRQSQGVPSRGVKCCFLARIAVLVGSCNGLLCVTSLLQIKPTYCICNPVTGECVTLPHPTSFSSDYYFNHSGFGFCPKTEQYKVILFLSSEHTLRTEALVHTLGTESWRNIGEAPLFSSLRSFDCFLDGKLHFITASHKELYSFDLETEKFKPVPMPAHFSLEYCSEIPRIYVGVISGCLCLCYPFTAAYFEVYTMQEYGVRESWIKKFSIDIKFCCGLRAMKLLRPIKFSNNGELLFLSKHKTLVSYNTRKKSFRYIKNLGDECGDAIAYVPSFVSLRSHVFKSGITYEKIKLESSIQVQNASCLFCSCRLLNSGLVSMLRK